MRTSRFTPGLVVRDGGSLLPAEVAADVEEPLEGSPAGEGAGDGGAPSPAISAMFQLNGSPADGPSSKWENC